MATRVYLHVGTPKTGTTFLQEVLWSQVDEVNRQRVLLPGSAFQDHYLACMDVVGNYEKAPRAEGAWESLVAECASWKGDALISHELFAGCVAEHIARMVTDLEKVCDEVHVVVTARDLARQIPAEWQEHLKHRSTLTLEQFLDAVRTRGHQASWFWLVQDVADLARRWAEHVPPERIHVVTVPASGTGPDVLWGRFAATVGLEPDSFSLEVSNPNSSVGVEQAELLRRLNVELDHRLDRRGAYPVLVKDQLVHQFLARREGAKIQLTREAWDFATERSRVMAEELAGLGVDVAGALEELVPSGVGAGSDELAVAETDQLLVEAVASLAAVLETYDATRARLHREIAQLRHNPPIDPEAHPVRRALVRASRRWPLVNRAKHAYKRRVQRS